MLPILSFSFICFIIFKFSKCVSIYNCAANIFSSLPAETDSVAIAREFRQRGKRRLWHPTIYYNIPFHIRKPLKNNKNRDSSSWACCFWPQKGAIHSNGG